MAIGYHVSETVVCHCYAVTEQQIRLLMDAQALQTVEEVSLHTGAGTGCTACQCRIRRILAGQPISCGVVDACGLCGVHGGQCACQTN